MSAQPVPVAAPRRMVELEVDGQAVRVFEGETIARIASFFRDESCGQCVPCRVGTIRQEEAIHRLSHNGPGSHASDFALLDEVGLAMKDASICGLGQTAYSAIESAIKRLRLYGDAVN